MKRIVFKLTISLLTFVIGLCAASLWQTVSTEIPQNPSRQQQTRSPIAEREIFENFINEHKLKFAGYEASKRHKRVRIEGVSHLTDITYAVITRNGKIVSTLDGFESNYHPIGTKIRFGLFPFLGQPSRQLVIEQSQLRNWTYFIVDFSPGYQIVFDSGRWGLGRELSYQDIDGDGVFEISQAVTAFAFFDNLTYAASHLVDITFKYDRGTRQYLPANQIFQNRSLERIEDEIAKLNRDDERRFASDVLRILLPYIYAGQEKEARAFYDREYTLADKEVLKQKIKARLGSEPVYRFIYSN
jgi:hypothetical protein